jgi:AcrR family transcriptional regulator
MIDAAHHLFLSRGYAATTLKDVAEAAGVALPTIYSVFGSKRQLLLAVFDAARLGDPEADQGPNSRRDPLLEMLSHPGPKQIAAEVRRTREGGAPVARIISKAAAADQHISELWHDTQNARHTNMKALALALQSHGLIGEDAPIDHTADVLWTLTSNEIYQMLVLDRGWSPDEYEEWLREMLKVSVFDA